MSALRGGPSATILTLSREFARQGLKVDIATTDDGGLDHLEAQTTKPTGVGGVSYYYFSKQTRFYTFSWPLSSWLGRHLPDYDLIHIHALFTYPAIPASISAAYHHIPYIVRPLGVLNRWGMQNRHPWLKKLSFSLIESRIIRRAAVVHYTSDQEALEARELGVDHRSVVIPNPVDLPDSASLKSKKFLRQRYPEVAGKTVILFLSRLDPKKGLDLLLSAFSRVRAKFVDTVLVVAGTGDVAFDKAMRWRATELGIGPDVIWTGFVNGQDKWSLFHDADLFVLPSYSENFGIAVVEAMAAGLPVVVSDQVGVCRTLSAYNAGIVVPCSVEPLAGALARLVESKELRLGMGQNGKRLATETFSVERIARQLIEVYREITQMTADRRRPTAEKK